MTSVRNFAAGRMNLPLLERLSRSGPSAPATSANSFIDLMKTGVAGVNAAQNDAQSSVHELLTGGEVSEVEVFSSVQKADMAFRMLVQVRNKLMQAYEEINAIRI
jgi:flagellar hook-basal body complex protein FliE